MKTINVNPTEPIDLRLTVPGATYYLRVYSDGTFDVHGRDRDGSIIALGAVGMDGISADGALGTRLGRFLADNRDTVL